MAYIVTSWKFLFLGIRGDSSGILGDGAVDERRGAGGFSPVTCAMGEACREPGAGGEGHTALVCLTGWLWSSQRMLSCVFTRNAIMYVHQGLCLYEHTWRDKDRVA